MNIHPDILVHWTDRKWAKQPLTDRLRSNYVERLVSFYQNGLWLTDQADAVEVIHGAFDNKTMIHPGAILCLTELRLSLVEKHIGRYGSLGIGFRRSFMMHKGANPVFYLQNNDAGVVNTNIGLLVEAAEHNPPLRLFLSYVKAMSKGKGQVSFSMTKLNGDASTVLCLALGSNHTRSRTDTTLLNLSQRMSRF
jgi:hypothetical protein